MTCGPWDHNPIMTHVDPNHCFTQRTMMVRPGVHTSPVNKPYVCVKKKPTHLTVPPCILHCYCVISLSYDKQAWMMRQEKGWDFFMSRVHSSSLPLALDNTYMCAVRCLLLLVFKKIRRLRKEKIAWIGRTHCSLFVASWSGPMMN